MGKCRWIIKSLFAKYIKEREGKEVIEWKNAFLVYELMTPYAYLQDLYIEPYYRQQGICDEIEAEFLNIAKDNGCTVALTSLCLKDRNWWRSKRAIRKRKYKFFRLDKPTQMVYFKKEI